MKVLAMYLPQFHTVKENDEWWGKGFTDWVAVDAAKPLYEGHIQPRVPLNNYQYNLMDKSALEWQCSLVKNYDIDGLCIYHYWFKDGKRILEKPVENLLDWTDINLPFCFCWANERWATSWENIGPANVWSSLISEEMKFESKVLLDQKYGDKKEWREHFLYLLPFFKDPRYIRIDNRPVFYIYKPEEVLCFNDMKKYWDELAHQSGIDPILFIGRLGDDNAYGKYDWWVRPAPIHKEGVIPEQRKDRVRIKSTEDMWEYILNEKYPRERVGYSGFTSYDDTPRHGINGTVYEGSTPTKFFGFLCELFRKNDAIGMPITFINAWNEWGEGMYLEPDEEHGFSYLEQISKAKMEYKGKSCTFTDNTLVPEIKCRSKSNVYLKIYDKWMTLKDSGVSLAAILERRGYKSVAIYGMGELGKHLYSELEKSGVEVKCYIDRKDTNIPLKHYYPNEMIEGIDAIIVTAVMSYHEVYELYENHYSGRIISIEEIINESI